MPESIVEDITEKQAAEPDSQIVDDTVGSKETVIQATLPAIQATDINKKSEQNKSTTEQDTGLHLKKADSYI